MMGINSNESQTIELPLWFIRCGDLNGSVKAATAEAAFLKLVDTYSGGLALLFHASNKASYGRGSTYHSTEAVLKNAGLWGG